MATNPTNVEQMMDAGSYRFPTEGAVKAGLGLTAIRTMKLRITADDLTAEATTQVFDFADLLPAGCILMGVGSRVDTLATDGVVTVASATLDLGVTGSNADRWIDARDVLTGSGATGFVREDPAAPGDGTAALPLPLTSATQASVLMTFDVNCDTITAFDATCFLSYFVMEDPEA